MFKHLDTAERKIRLYDMARDPVVAAFFRRGEGDTGELYAVPVAPKPKLPELAAEVA